MMSIFPWIQWKSLLVLSAIAVSETEAINDEAARSRDVIKTGEISYEIGYGDGPRGSSVVSWREPILKDRVVFDRRDGLYAFLDRWTAEEPTFLRNDGEPLVRRAESGGLYRRIVLRPDRVYEYFPDALSDGSHLAIMEYMTAKKPDQFYTVFRPWNFGLIPDIVESRDYPSFESVIKHAAAERPSVSEDVVDGNRCWLVEYHTEDARCVKVWHDREKSMSVRRIVMEGSNESWSWRNSLESTLEKHESGDATIWFPSEVVFRSETTGASDADLVVLQRIRILNARFNLHVPPEQFTVKALEPASHTGILPQFENDKPMQEWDGQNVVLRRANVPVLQSMPRDSRRLILQGLGNLLLFAATVAWLNSRRRHQKTT